VVRNINVFIGISGLIIRPARVPIRELR